MKVFISYSHKDKRYRTQLDIHLALLKREGVIEVWHDRKNTAGREWADQIDENFEQASIILLLISSDFLASDYCYDKEMGRAIAKHQIGEARVIPIIIRSADWPLGPTHPDVARSLNNLAELYREQGKYARAEPLYKRALIICEQTLGPAHPDVARSLNNLARLYHQKGKFAKAAPLYQHALDIVEKAFGSEHPNTKKARENYDDLLKKMEDEKD